MSKRIDGAIVYHGNRLCQGVKQSDGLACTNGAYYEQAGRFLCGVHSDKKKRTLLPKDKEEKRRRLTTIDDHHTTIEIARLENKAQGRKGTLRCYKMKMMKEVPLVDGYLNVFPNNRHQERIDGFGCSSLSPMRLGPVIHRQPAMPNAINIENYHQFNKAFADEVDIEYNPLPSFWDNRRKAYQDVVPHRHKKLLASLSKEVPLRKSKYPPLYTVHSTLDGKQQRRFRYVESRYFYCTAYEALAPKTEDYKRLKQMLEDGKNLIICGYDGYEVTQSLYDHYCDEKQPFGHELVLYTLLTTENVYDYPWHRYRESHPTVYQDIAYMCLHQ